MEIRIAILDLYDGHANQGMRCLREIINLWGKKNEFSITLTEFNVRQKLEVPDTFYDIYISSGGPGSPLESENSEWENKYFGWIRSIEKWNDGAANFPKKNIFFICHSFQLACRYYDVATVCRRASTAFGVFPMHKLDEAKDEAVFDGLRDPFYAVDSRDFQVIEPNHNRLKELGAKILAIEKERPHVPYERALMAIRFNENFIGTQFHPEADAVGMTLHLQTEDRKQTVIENYGEEKWQSMIDQLNDPDKIMWTYNHVIPNFLNIAVGELV
jgi:homoserine O-succinyltransferase/O-acetyltransferase